MINTTLVQGQEQLNNMAMDIKLWSKLIGYSSIKSYPSLPCPHCHSNELKLDQESIQTKPLPDDVLAKNRKYKEEKLKFNQSQEKVSQSIGQQDNVWLQLLGTGLQIYQEYNNPLNGSPHLLNCFFTCQSCDENVSASGIKLLPEKGENSERDAQVKLDHFSPPLIMFPISKNVPDSICEELFDAFKYFHFDPLSSAAKLRRAMERFCDDLQIEGKNLHRRIQDLAKTRPEEATYLETLKLVGNEGTHGSEIDELDLLHSFQIFQFVLELYDRQAHFNSLQHVYKKLTEKMEKNQPRLEYKPRSPESDKQD
jgi:hypothetical protein